jgi:nucleoside-diphosphate-sugar epimerase
MNIFVTGATGYIGSAVVEHLIKRGHSVSGLVRSEESARKLEDLGASPVRGDLTETDTITEAARAAGGVIHTASTNNADAPKADRKAVNAILSALEGTKKPFIYTSGIWVVGNTGDRVADESTELNPTPLARWRAETEREILEAAKRGVRVIVIRPAVVYGRCGGLIASFTKSAKENGAAKFIGDGDNRWPLVHVDDLAELYSLALEKAEPGSLFFAAHGPSIRVSKIAEAASRAAGAQGRTESWPLEDARNKLGAYADALALDQQVSAARAIRDLNWNPSAPSLLEEFDQGCYRSFA